MIYGKYIWKIRSCKGWKSRTYMPLVLPSL